MNRDRLELLRAQTQLNGIDYVDVSADQRELSVHFLLASPDATTLAAAVQGATISGGEAIHSVPVRPIQAGDWSTVAGKPRLLLRVDAPGDFSIYTLTVHSAPTRLDRFFDHIAFSFKAGCPSTLDCEAPAHVCPVESSSAPLIDYLAKD
ncbi:MAG TPA: hypothetical protein VMF89_37345, partial [Polyangiales bacterium]|nr:hypothetical protein [Polyangiales bacterium]